MLRKEIFLHIDRFLLIVLAFFLPLEKQIIPFIIAAIILRWLLSAQFLRLPAAVRQSRDSAYLILFAVFYIIHFIGLINTDNYKAGLFDVEVKASLLIFPVIFITFNRDVLNGKWLLRVFAAFILGCMAAMVICLGRAILIWQQTGDTMAFYYIELSIFHHPSYFALYINFAIALCILMLIEMRDMLWPLGRWLTVLAIFLFMWFIVMLSSKAGVLGLVLILFLGMIYLIIRQKLIVQGIVGFLVAITFFFLMINIFPNSVIRIKTATTAVEESDRLRLDDTEGTAERILIWKAGLNLVKEHFLTGAGTGDVKDVLLAEYDRLGMTAASQQKLNAHNQYLQTTIALGVIGLLILVLSLFLPLLEAYRTNHFPYLLFLILFGFNLLFESMLETQAGVVFYAFFNALFYATKKFSKPIG